MRRRKWVLVFAVMLVTTAVSAQEHRARGMLPEPKLELLTEDGELSLPFELINNHLIIPVKLQGSTFKVILDTGMPMSGLALYETEQVKNLELNRSPIRAQIGTILLCIISTFSFRPGQPRRSSTSSIESSDIMDLVQDPLFVYW